MTRFTLKYEECRVAFEQLLGLCPKEDTFREEAWQQWYYGTKSTKEETEKDQAFLNDEILKEITEISRRDLERAQAAVNTAITNLESFDVTADVEASSDEEDQRSNLPTEEEMDFRSRHQSMSYRSW